MDSLNRKDFLIGRLPFGDDRDSLDSCSLESFMASDASSIGKTPSFHESGRLIPESAYTGSTDTCTPQSARWRPPTGFSPMGPPQTYYHPGQYFGPNGRKVPPNVGAKKGTKRPGRPDIQQTHYGGQYIEIRHVDAQRHRKGGTRFPAIATKKNTVHGKDSIASVYGNPQLAQPPRRCVTVAHKIAGQEKSHPKEETAGVTLPPIHTKHIQRGCSQVRKVTNKKPVINHMMMATASVQSDVDVLNTRALAPPFNTYVDKEASARFIRQYYGPRH